MHLMINDQSQRFFQILLVIGHLVLVIQFTHRKACGCLASLSAMINPNDILQNWFIKRGNWLTVMEVQQQQQNEEINNIL